MIQPIKLGESKDHAGMLAGIGVGGVLGAAERYYVTCKNNANFLSSENNVTDKFIKEATKAKNHFLHKDIKKTKGVLLKSLKNNGAGYDALDDNAKHLFHSVMGENRPLNLKEAVHRKIEELSGVLRQTCKENETLMSNALAEHFNNPAKEATSKMKFNEIFFNTDSFENQRIVKRVFKKAKIQNTILGAVVGALVLGAAGKLFVDTIKKDK